MIKTYSLKVDGDKQLSPHFKVKEFRCNDGSDKILVSDELIALLEKIRTHFGKPINIISGYRTKDYNKRVGGADSSQHLLGTAADITIKGVDPLAICRYAESLNAGGIGWYLGRFSHVDVRTKKARWKRIKSGQPNISVVGFSPVLRKGDKNNDVKDLQSALNKYGYNLKADGDFGTKTYDAVIDFQRKNRLTVDGVVGAKTWQALGV